MSEPLKDPKEYQNIFHWAETQKDGSIPSFGNRKNDPYEYQSGFGNSFESEAVPGEKVLISESSRKMLIGLLQALSQRARTIREVSDLVCMRSR
ncbi:homogentisate-dioxygenase protein [Pyrenophora tritici-repentis]|nr:homogentisate-dioxygenase protein [Pyrenophora tritici-repentis]